MMVQVACKLWLLRWAILIPLVTCIDFPKSTPLLGSDHADPITVRFFGRPESNLTGLFAFEEDEKLVMVLCARPGLADQPVDLKRLSFSLLIDMDSEVKFSDRGEADEFRTFRYGGWVTQPEKIQEDLELQFDFRETESTSTFESTKPGNPISLKPTWIKAPESIERKLKSSTRSWVGIRDDPFILYGFYSTNVVAMVVEFPIELLGDSPNLLIWAKCEQNGRKIDHVGRSLRTMLPRFDELNRLHPSEHVRTIRAKHTDPGILQDIKSFALGPVFGIRHYDFEPDVMIFSRARWQENLAKFKVENRDSGNRVNPIAFPNGRRLEDDVATLMRDRGDALLFEVSTLEAHEDNRLHPTKNNKPFLRSFPYLAAPNKNPIEPEMPHLRTDNLVLLAALAVLLTLISFLLPWFLLFRTRRRLQRVERELATRSA